jgi:hypothetical protein
MPKQTTQAEEKSRDWMKHVYNEQKARDDGWQDWGMFTAHVVHGLIEEVRHLRAKMTQAGVHPPPERDPFS